MVLDVGEAQAKPLAPHDYYTPGKTIYAALPSVASCTLCKRPVLRRTAEMRTGIRTKCTEPECVAARRRHSSRKSYEWRRKDPEWVAKSRQWNKEYIERRRKEDPEWYEARIAKQAAARRTPEAREADAARKRKMYAEDPDYKAKVLARERAAYARRKEA